MLSEFLQIDKNFKEFSPCDSITSILFSLSLWCKLFFQKLHHSIYLCWQLPWVMSKFPSVTLYYFFLRGNDVTQIGVLVKPLCKSQAQFLDLWVSTISFYLLLIPNLSNFACILNNAHKTINTHLWSLWSTGLWSITDYWGNWGVSWVFTLLGVTYP